MPTDPAKSKEEFLRRIEEICEDTESGPFPVWFYMSLGDYMEASFGVGRRYAVHTEDLDIDYHCLMEDDSPIGFYLDGFSRMTEQEVNNAFDILSRKGFDIGTEMREGILKTWTEIVRQKNG